MALDRHQEVSMHSFSLIALTLAACTTAQPHNITAPDGGVISDADLGADGRPLDGSTDAIPGDGAMAACVVTGDGSLFSQCCPFAPSCATGLACYWTFANDPVPQQDTAACMSTGATPVGQTCQNTNDACVAGAWCAPDANTPTTGTGTCRALCDPAGAACPTGQTCTHMPHCSTPGNCPPAATAEIGSCQ